ncbi:MAG: sugar phosphate isomerase/epimerase [Alphaproteobacteria bacterium]|nr:sugar phosphate isomerase/epimerase [Alphaproteobacteria bacterium]
MTRLVSVAHLTLIELDPPEMVAACAAAGFDRIDLRLKRATPTDAEYPMFGDTPMMRETRKRLADTGLQVAGVEIIRLRTDTDIDSFLPLFEAGQRLGATRLKVVADDADEAAVTARFAETCEKAAPFGLAVDIEFLPWSGVRTVAQAVRVVTRAGQPNGHVLVDALHLDRSGGGPGDLAGLDRHLFGYLDLCDAPAARPTTTEAIIQEARAERMIPGTGGLPLAELIRCFPADFPVCLEIPMKAVAREIGLWEHARRCVDGTRRFLAANGL